jgi:hypothetical protein
MANTHVSEPKISPDCAIADSFVAAIENTKVRNRPFSHFYLNACFPPNIYTKMISYLPDDEFYRQLLHKDALRPDGSSTRSLFELTTENCMRLPQPQRDFWLDVSKAMHSPAVKQAIFHKLRKDLAVRYNISEDAVGEIEAYPEPRLFRDVAGYKILPHPDTSDKIVTAQFYLPSDRSQRQLGTSIYRLQKGMKMRSWLKHLGFPKPEKFKRVKTFDFLPNSGYAFAVSKNSWHGRDLVPDNLGTRNSLMLIYFREPGLAY